MKISLGSDGINIGIAENTSDVKDISVETSQDTETKNTQKMNRTSKSYGSALGYLPVKLNSDPYSSSTLPCKADSFGLSGLSHPLLNLRSLVGSA